MSSIASSAVPSSGQQPSVLNVHTPTTSFAIIHSLAQDNLQAVYDKLSRKAHSDYKGDRVGPGWLKYEFNDAVWNLDDDSDYTIFVWRQKQQSLDPATSNPNSPAASTLFLQKPGQPLPAETDYRNPSFYLFRPVNPIYSRSISSSPRPPSTKSRRSTASKLESVRGKNGTIDDGIPAFKKQFDKFHSENGVRTVMGNIGPVKDVRMLLKSGYRHVYISRKFALRHGFIAKDAAPGHNGYSGLVNIGKWPITLTASLSSSTAPDAPANVKTGEPKPTMMSIYLSEEPHFDVVLGRSFFEKRQIRIDPADLTDVVCLDTGEKIDCELVILKDGRGDIVTVT